MLEVHPGAKAYSYITGIECLISLVLLFFEQELGICP